jgi:hypothetical protein
VRHRRAPPTSSSDTEPRLGATIVYVAWLTILLGLAMEALLLLLVAGFGVFPGLRAGVADLVMQVSWAFIVCIGLALGRAASTLRTPLMGILGLLAAPLAFTVARSVHEGARRTLQIAGEGAAYGGVSLLLVIALLGGIEYGCLGMALSWMERRPWGKGVLGYVVVGLTAGVLFGSLSLALTYWGTPSPPTTVALVSQGVNEMLLPVGCSLVLYTAGVLQESAP